MELIRPLYDIERTLRESKAPPEEVKKKREEESSPIAEEFFKALVKRNQDTQNPPRNKLKDAIDYALTRQQHLSSWLQNPYLPIDNNQVERAIRPVTVGRKNYLLAPRKPARERLLSIPWWRNANAQEQIFISGSRKYCESYRLTGFQTDI